MTSESRFDSIRSARKWMFRIPSHSGYTVRFPTRNLRHNEPIADMPSIGKTFLRHAALRYAFLCTGLRKIITPTCLRHIASQPTSLHWCVGQCWRCMNRWIQMKLVAISFRLWHLLRQVSDTFTKRFTHDSCRVLVYLYFAIFVGHSWLVLYVRNDCL